MAGNTRMHADEVGTDAALVRRLLQAQYPQWARRRIAPVASSGTEYAMYRLGADMVVRLPRLEGSVHGLEKEHRWLPVLAPRLPLAIPEPLARGAPGQGFPHPWSVYRWIEGETAFDGRIGDLSQAARDVAAFIGAFQSIDVMGAPRPARGRGTPLATVDETTRRRIGEAADLVDVEAVTAAWGAALRVPEWDRAPVWFHGDIASWNLLVRDGRVAAVIDFSLIGAGDPACDLIVAWELFEGDSREAFRRALGVDDATWARGRGWALCTALWALPYYLHTNPLMATQARRKIAAVLADTSA